MPYCPECRYEYRPGFTTCPDCDVELVDELPKEEPSEPELAWVDLVTVESFHYEAQAQTAKILLDSCGIPAFIANSAMSQADQFIVFADGGVRLQVHKEDATEAARILAEDHQQSSDSVD